MSVFAPSSSPASVHYAVDASRTQAHLFHIELTLAQPQAQQQLSLPAWIPGSYMLREFAQHLQGLQAEQNGQTVALMQLRKDRWQVDCVAGQPLRLRYAVYAFDASVRTAWLDSERGFFNPTSLCLMAQGQTDAAHSLRLQVPAHFAGSVAAAVQATDGLYTFADYDHLADTPFVFGRRLWQGEFEAGGAQHVFVLDGAPACLDGQRLLADAQRICQAQHDFWQPAGGSPLFGRYVFMLHATEGSYGGLEHKQSTALVCTRKALPRLGMGEPTADYINLLGLISHEYFHNWNVKRMRPQELAQYDYSQENYTELLWFFEGLTSYYDDLFLYRTGLISPAAYLGLLSRHWQGLEQTPGAALQSVAQSSFDAWVKYYRQNENTPNSTVSYYGKGALLGLCLDLTLRHEGQGNLDAVMRLLWQRSAGGPISEADIATALAQVGGRSYAPELAAWVHGTEALPLPALWAQWGGSFAEPQLSWAQRLGLRVQEGAAGIQITHVLRGGAAEAAGLAAGDEWLGLSVDGQSWRLRQLEQLDWLLPSAVQTGQADCELLHVRDQRILRSVLRLPAAPVAISGAMLMPPEAMAACFDARPSARLSA